MQVEIRTIGQANTVSISCSKPEIIQVLEIEPIHVTLSLTKDGIDGKDGKNADLSILGNYERDFAQDFLMALNT
jgi:hypothetical protein